MKITETIELRVKPVLDLIASHDDADSTYRIAAFDRVIELCNERKGQILEAAAAEAQADFQAPVEG